MVMIPSIGGATAPALISLLAFVTSVQGFVVSPHHSPRTHRSDRLSVSVFGRQSTTTLPVFPDISFDAVPSLWVASDDAATTVGQSKETAIAVFVVGLIPFGIATVEFWRRIAAGSSFGTSEPVVFTIGEDDAPTSSRGKQVLGKDALLTAYAIFSVVAAVLALVLYSVISSPDQGVYDTVQATIE